MKFLINPAIGLISLIMFMRLIGISIIVGLFILFIHLGG
jgi:hypothetical protein